jgi:hypothetical protein
MSEARERFADLKQRPAPIPYAQLGRRPVNASSLSNDAASSGMSTGSSKPARVRPCGVMMLRALART